MLIVVCMIGWTSIVHAQSYAQYFSSVEHNSSEQLRLFGGADLQAQAEIVQKPGGQVSITLKVNSILNTIEVNADSVVALQWSDERWSVLYLRGDTLHLSLLQPKSNQRSDIVLCIGPSLHVLQTWPNGASFLSADSLYIFTRQSTGSLWRLQAFARNQRSVVYAVEADSTLLLATVLNAELKSIELYQDSQWQNIGIVAAYDNMICHSRSSVYTLNMKNGRYALHTMSLTQNATRVQSLDLPFDFYEARCLCVSNDTCVIAFRNGLVRTTASTILAADHLALHELDAPCIMSIRAQTVQLRSSYHSYTYQIQEDRWHHFRSALAWLRNYGLVLVLLLSILFLAIRALRYRRQLRDVIELGTTGISFVVDTSMRLRRINSRARDLFEMDATTPLRRVLKYYCNGESQRIVESFVASALAVRGSQTQKLMFKSTTGDQEIIFTAQPLRSFSGGFDGLVVSGVDITEELERKRIVNWAQLAHDMQTNLSIIKLNAEQLEGAVEVQHEEKRNRIRHQASLLLQRVRDIVSIGRDEQLHLSELDLRSLFLEVVREFDDTSFSHVQFVTPDRSTIAKVDKAKLLRALRNVVENALRAIGAKPGTIEFFVNLAKTELVIGVRDTGSGMDEQTLANFFKPYFSNYRQFGGTGIGTMIMQRAIALHQGKVEVQTELGKGTTILFKLPLNLYVRG